MKMRRCENETPTIGRTLRSDALGKKTNPRKSWQTSTYATRCILELVLARVPCIRVSTNSLVSLRAHASDCICTSVLPGKLNDDLSCQLLSFPGVSA